MKTLDLMIEIKLILQENNIETEVPKTPRTWRRSDGAFYKDFWAIDFPENDEEKVWQLLNEHFGDFSLEVKGEFGSSDYQKTIKYKNLLLKKGIGSIEVGSASRLKNHWVWDSRPI